MQVVDITRKFTYNGVTLADPNPALGPDQIREFYAMQYPELNNAVVEGPVTKDAVATYWFARAAGAKGASAPASAKEVVSRILVGHDGARRDPLVACAAERRYARPAHLIAAVAGSRSSAPQMPIPAKAFGFWG
jgi:PRTRC genetic system protein C